MNINTKYFLRGSEIDVIRISSDTALDHIPPRVYSIQFEPMRGYFLSVIKDQFSIPERIYGDVEQRARRCINTYRSRVTSTGILLTGDKGTGKTLLLSLLSNTVINELKLPVIMVRQPFSGETFDSFIPLLGECCLVFDEFGKTYNSVNHTSEFPGQTSLLPLLDGADKTKRLIIMTENRVNDINEHILNRPSRAYYHFKYTKLDEATTKEYCSDFNVPPDITNRILDLSRRSYQFSFDMLQAIIEEYFRYNESFEDAITHLNIDTGKIHQQQLEIIRVINQTDKTELSLAPDQPTIIDKPADYDMSARVAIILDENQYHQHETIGHNSPSPEIVCHSNTLQTNPYSPTQQFNTINLRFTVWDLVYASGNKFIYEVDNILIMTQLVDSSQTQSYSDLTW